MIMLNLFTVPLEKEEGFVEIIESIMLKLRYWIGKLIIMRRTSQIMSLTILETYVIFTSLRHLVIKINMNLLISTWAMTTCNDSFLMTLALLKNSKFMRCVCFILMLIDIIRLHFISIEWKSTFFISHLINF